jgi:hypothetical protein
MLGGKSFLQLRLDGGVVRLEKIQGASCGREVQKMSFGARKDIEWTVKPAGSY